MSKTLTEQYYEGTLPSGHYYFNNGHNTYPVEHHQTTPQLCVDGIRVVDKVPEYDQFAGISKKVDELEKKLDVAVKTLEWYDGLENLLIGWEICTGQPKGTAQEALKRIADFSKTIKEVK